MSFLYTALKGIADLSKSIYIPRGINTDALDRSIKWDFTPADLKVGDHVSGGDIFGSVYENSLLDQHKALVGPKAMGTITHLAEKGAYTVDVRILFPAASMMTHTDIVDTGNMYRMSLWKLSSKAKRLNTP